MNNQNNNLNNINININNSYDHQGNSEENNKKNYYSLTKNQSPYLQRIFIFYQYIKRYNQSKFIQKEKYTCRFK